MSKKRKVKPLPSVTLKTVTVCFQERTIDIDGRRYTLPDGVHCYSFPIASGDVVVMPREPWRVA